MRQPLGVRLVDGLLHRSLAGQGDEIVRQAQLAEWFEGRRLARGKLHAVHIEDMETRL